MFILALVHRVPYPPNKGEKIRAYHELRHLASRGHVIDLATFADVPEDREHGGPLSEFCRTVRVVPKDRRLSRVRSISAAPRGLPLSVAYFDSWRMRSQVAAWTRARHYDVAFCYSSPMAEYVRRRAGGPHFARVIDFVDVDSEKWRQYAERTPLPTRLLYAFEARALAAYEREVAAEFDASLFVSAAEAELFRAHAPDARAVDAVPNGVDADAFGATARRPREGARPLLVFVGQMDYFANVDAVTSFAEDVFPKIRAQLPEAEFRIVGRAPTPAVKRLAERPGVTVTGAVDDVRTHLAEATLMVAPLRIARGIQNKVLEAMAARVAIVASSAALEGIELTPGVHAIQADEPARAAEEIVALARDPGRRAALEAAARARVVERYAWAPAMDKLERILLNAVEDTKRKSACAERPR